MSGRRGSNYFPGLSNPRGEFERLRTASRAIGDMQACFRPFSSDYLVLHALQTALNTACFHFTKDPHFFGGKPCGQSPHKDPANPQRRKAPTEGLEAALDDFAASWPRWRITLVGGEKTWLATITSPDGAGANMPPQSYEGWTTTTPRGAVKAAVGRAVANGATLT